MIPFRTPFFFPMLYPSLLWRMPEGSKKLYLTFDDGPIPAVTEFVLDTLQRYKAKATFFCIGDNVTKHPQVFQKILRGGHGIGNHTHNHLNGWRTKNDQYLENISRCEKTLQTNGQPSLTSNLFRPPYGRITRAQIRLLPVYDIVMWDVLTHDYNKNLSPENCLKKSIAATRDGSIIVFHDSLKAEKNMTYTLPRYIEYFSERGFSFLTLT